MSESSTLISAKHISRLWILMTEMYGHKWLKSFGEQDQGTWLRVLGNVTVEQMRRGIEIIANSGSEWPPSLPEFKAMCLGMGNHKVHKSHQIFKGLAPPEPDIEMVENCLSELREIVNKDKDDSE